MFTFFYTRKIVTFVLAALVFLALYLFAAGMVVLTTLGAIMAALQVTGVLEMPATQTVGGTFLAAVIMAIAAVGAVEFALHCWLNLEGGFDVLREIASRRPKVRYVR